MAAIRFKHLSISATNLDESLRFYEEMFGLERIPTYNFGFRRQCLRCGAHQLQIFELEDAVPVRQHFALDVDDFTAVCRAAKERRALESETGLMSARSIGGIFRSSEARESRAAEWRGAAGDALSRAPEGPRAGVRDAPGWRRRRRFGLV